MLVIDDGNFDVFVLLCPFPCHIRECFWIHVIWRAVSKITRKVDSRGNTSVDAYECFKFFLLAFVASNSNTSFSFFVLFFLHLVLIVRVISKKHSFSKSAHTFQISTSKANGEISTVCLLASRNNCSPCLSVSVSIGVIFLAEANEHCLSAFTTNKSHCRLCLSFEISISKNTVDLGLKCHMQACSMGFWHDICSFKEGKNKGSIDVMTWTYADLHGHCQPLEGLETLRIDFSKLDRFFVFVAE